MGYFVTQDKIKRNSARIVNLTVHKRKLHVPYGSYDRAVRSDARALRILSSVPDEEPESFHGSVDFPEARDTRLFHHLNGRVEEPA